MSASARRSTSALPHGRAALFGALAQACRPRPLTTVSAWADKHRVLSSKASGEPGPWRTSRTPYLREILDSLSASSPVQRIVLQFAAQTGKALDLDTPIPTPDGWVRMGDISAGDLVFDDRGRPTRVRVASEVFRDRECFRVVFSDGAAIVADAEHRWTVTDEADYRARQRVTLTTREIAATYRVREGRNRYATDVVQPLDLPPADLQIDPYTLGVWLGDGHGASAQITKHERDAPEIVGRIRAAGYQVDQKANRGGTITWQIDPAGPRDGICLRGHILSGVGVYAVKKHGRRVHICAECQRQATRKSQYGTVPDPVVRPTFHARLRALGLINNKHIPPAYLRASREQRMELLRGLMDTDGYADPRGSNCEIASSYPLLADGIVELIRTLGFKPHETFTHPKIGRPSRRITFVAHADWPVFHLERKRARLKPMSAARTSKTFRRRIVSVEPVSSRPVRCIAVEAESHLFLAGREMVPTHNTEVGLGWIGYVMHHAPAPMLVVVPTLEVRKRWVKQRLDPLIAETPVLRELVGTRKRDATNAEDMKDFPGGMLVVGGANSPASLASMPIRYVLCDEVDRFPWEVGQEGDPLGLIDERTKTFPRRKVLLVSTPTTKGLSRIEGEYERSDMREYHVPCPHCGEMQVLRWRHDDGTYGLVHSAATGVTRYACRGCGTLIDEHHKTAMLARGAWIPRHPERGVRGYHLSGLYSPLGLGFTWGELWDKWQEAHGDTANLKRFINTTLAQSWEEKGDSIADVALIARLEEYPEGLPLRLVTSFTDVQKDRLETTVVGWGAGEEAWVLEHEIHAGDSAAQDVWDELDDYLAGHGVALAGIDAGFNAQMVYDFCAKRKWAIPTKGVSGMGRPLVEDERRRRQRLRSRRRKGQFVEPLGVDQGKALVYSRLKLTESGPGYVHFPSRVDFDDEYFAQLAAEKLVTRTRGGRPRQEWVQTRPRNEALDCLVGNYAVLRLHLNGRDLHALPVLGRRSPESDPVSSPPPVAPSPAPRPIVSPGGWNFDRRT